MNFYLKSLLFLPVLFLGLIFLPTQDFGPYGDLSSKEVEVGLADFKPPRDWETEVIDTGAEAAASLALDKSNQPNISYIGDKETTSAQLKFAQHNGNMWNLEQVIQVAPRETPNSLQIDSAGNPHISYYAHNGTALRYIFKNSVWTNTTVDEDPLDDTELSMQLTSQGLPRVAYWDGFNGQVRYASFTGTVWNTPETIFEMTCAEPFPPIVSLALDSNNDPHISFYDCEASNLKYAYQDGSAWQYETVDSSFRSGLNSSIAIDSKDNPHISYRSGQFQAGRLRYTFFNGTNWEDFQVDPDFWYGEHSSLALDTNDRPHIGYTSLPGGEDDPNHTHELRVAFKYGNGWYRETIDESTIDESTNSGDITSISLQVDKNGHTHVAYIDGGSQQLKYAHRDIYRWYISLPAIINDN